MYIATRSSPITSALVKPVIRSAAWFHSLTRPCASIPKIGAFAVSINCIRSLAIRSCSPLILTCFSMVSESYLRNNNLSQRTLRISIFTLHSEVNQYFRRLHYFIRSTYVVGFLPVACSRFPTLLLLQSLRASDGRQSFTGAFIWPWRTGYRPAIADPAPRTQYRRGGNLEHPGGQVQ